MDKIIGQIKLLEKQKEKAEKEKDYVESAKLSLQILKLKGALK